MRKMIVWFLSVGIALDAGALSAAEHDRPFVVFAAASLTEAVTEVSAAFTQQTGIAVKTLFAASAARDLNRSLRQNPTPSTFIDRSHVWEALHVDHETCEQRGLIVLSPGESQRQRHVQIDHGHNDNTFGTPPTCRSKHPSHTQAGRNEA